MFGDALISSLGVVLILFTLRDFVLTTLRLEGSGRLSGYYMSSAWTLARGLHRRLPGRQVLSHSGVMILLGNVLAWVLLLWLGWLLVFLPHAGSVVSSEGVPADFWSNVYFVGYSLITLGVGDFVPDGPLFQVATVLSAMSGFFLFTLSVTYLVPVVAAVVQARQLAAQIFLLGDNPTRLVGQVLEAGNPGVRQLHGLSGPIVLLSQHHFAYPVLTHFPSTSRATSSAVSLAVLDESLTLLCYGLRDEARVSQVLLEPLRKAIGSYLERHVGDLGDRSRQPPPPPSLEPLREAGEVPVTEEEFARKLDSLARRRTLLRDLLELEARDWSQVSGGGN